MNISDDPFLLILNKLTFSEYLIFRETHKRVKLFDKHVECIAKKMKCKESKGKIEEKLKNCNCLGRLIKKVIYVEYIEEKIIKIIKKFPNIKFSFELEDKHLFALSNELTKENGLKIYGLKINKCRQESCKYIPHVEELDLSKTNVTDVSMFGNVYSINTLNLSYTNVVDVSMLGNVRKLNLSFFEIKMLGNVNVLDLSHTLVKDVC
jgi:hypothetical protein